VVPRAATIGDLGHTMTIPQKCMNSDLVYVMAAYFPAGKKNPTHSYSTGDEYVKVKQ
jgi:hypothetical protein